MFERIVFYSGLFSLACAAVVLFAVIWGTARDAIRRRVRLHRLRVMYARADARARARAHEVARLEGWWHLPRAGR